MSPGGLHQQPPFEFNHYLSHIKLFVKGLGKIFLPIDKLFQWVYIDNMKNKLVGLGINHPKDLKLMLGCSMSLAYKVWYGKANLSRMQAEKIKQKTGASLDFLLG